MHIISSPHGGATLGLFEWIKKSAEMGDGLHHYLVFCAPDAVQKVSAIRPFVKGIAGVAMEWWNTKKHVPPLQRLLEYLRIQQLSRFGIKPHIELLRLIKQWRIDLIHTNNSVLQAGAIAARQARLPHLWHIRESIGEAGYLHFPLKDSALVRHIRNLCDQVVPMSDYVGEIFRHHGTQNIRTIYDGIESRDFKSARAQSAGKALRRAWGLNESQLAIVNVGSLTALIKRHDWFVEVAHHVAAQAKQAVFIVAGTKPNATAARHRVMHDYFQKLQRQVAAYGLSERWIWAGNVEDNCALMNAADVLLHTCPIEGFGRVVPEAMAASRPVVAWNSGGVRESIVHQKTGFLIDDFNVQAMAQQTLEIVHDARLRKALGKAGAAHVQSHFSLSDHATAMRNLCQFFGSF